MLPLHELNTWLILRARDEFWGEPIGFMKTPTSIEAPTIPFPLPNHVCALSTIFSGIARNKVAEDIEMMNDWLFSNEIIFKTNNWVFSPDVTARYFVPTSASESIGSTLTNGKKILSRWLC